MIKFIDFPVIAGADLFWGPEEWETTVVIRNNG